MKNTDMFEALNDLPDDMLAAAEAGKGRASAGGAPRRNWFSEHNGLVAAIASVVVGLGTLGLLLMAPWNKGGHRHTRRHARRDDRRNDRRNKRRPIGWRTRRAERRGQRPHRRTGRDHSDRAYDQCYDQYRDRR